MTKAELQAKVEELEAYQEGVRKQNRENMKKYLDKPGKREAWNAYQRERYHANKAKKEQAK